ncbi:hypothetical protein HMPREF1624_08313 [Sporothrix schenckii ATCC 58251]|uniref:Ribosomal RNA-processing protein 14/surfeit locus protein 6 C-terminal domain-containing protein n=1 Tax=Sporothrix schenckii (strain ATCC 58251 / de Perez 2211183) TaxID=1391915 RepID=U7PLR6_SPOS1|nr:hypothetical protein HMPREF1624_08313 [Sporothrix schenckii ATCC 58251]
MAGSSLQDRLRGHAQAFDGLLSLIPAKLYYGNGDEPSEQWRRKKQTKEEKNAARRANLDPENELNKSVKEVMEEHAARNKRKLAEMSGSTQGKKSNSKQAADSNDEQDEDEDEKEDDSQAEDDDDEDSIGGDIVKEQPGEGLKKAKPEAAATKGESAAKKQRVANAAEKDDEDGDLGISLADANLSAKQQKKLIKKQAKAEKRVEKRKNKSEKNTAQNEDTKMTHKIEEAPQPSKDTKEKKEAKAAVAKVAEADSENEHEQDNGSLQSGAGFAALLGDEDVPSAPSSPSPAPSDTFDTPLPSTEAKESSSTTTSISSVSIPASFSTSLLNPSTETASTTSGTPPKTKLQVPADTSALRARLAARIEALRAARKADVDELDSSGNVIRTRQQLIEARRQKQAERKAHKKELRKATRLEEDRKREEAIASARDSPLVQLGSSSSMNGAAAANSTGEIETNFSFGRVTFADGSQMSRDLSYVKDASAKKKGPAASDVKAQLARLESQKKRLAKMDDVQRREVEEKERWLAARKRAEGVGRGDGGGLTAAAAASGAISTEGARHSTEQLLKKAIKRKEKAKKKSEREWGERKDGVQKSIQDRQKKREDNLRKRKEDKMLHRAGLSKRAKQGSGKSKGGRPGFEGSSFGGRRK